MCVKVQCEQPACSVVQACPVHNTAAGCTVCRPLLAAENRPSAKLLLGPAQCCARALTATGTCGWKLWRSQVIMASTGSRLKARKVLLSASDTMHRCTSSELSCGLVYLQVRAVISAQCLALHRARLIMHTGARRQPVRCLAACRLL